MTEMTGRKGFIGRRNKNDRPGYIVRGNATHGVDSVSVKEVINQYLLIAMPLCMRC